MVNTTYEKIVEAAYKRFCKNGLAAITIAQVSRDAGFTKGAFYKTGFKVSKKQLIQDMWQHGMDKADFPIRAQKFKSWAEYKREMRDGKLETDFIRQLIILDGDQEILGVKLWFEKNFALLSKSVVRLLGNSPQQKRKMLKLVPGAGQIFILNASGATWKKRCDDYFAALEDIKRNTVP